jgi:predicted nucleic acid-binding protein
MPTCRELLLDVNVLLYASDQSSDRHLRARRFVESCAAGPEILCLTWPTLMAAGTAAGHDGRKRHFNQILNFRISA